ncbi:MAG: FkbM family methyltransferase [Crocinitomicaceae bacterium]|nr:FkbM family methyltransferase [Crocinitomicaceae bacterium]
MERSKKITMKLSRFFKKSETVVNIPFGKYILFYSEGTSIVERFKRDGHYEPEFVSHLVHSLKSIDGEKIFIDIGANIGMISLDCLNQVESLKIYAFEPGKHQFNLFQKTIQENNLSDTISLNPLALSNSKGSVDFYVHSTEHVSGDGFVDTKRAGKTKVVKVLTDTLDNWYHESTLSRCDVIKMDTEGAEFFILQGGRQLIEKFRPIIYIEINDKNIKNYPFEIDDLLRLFNEIGYNIFTLKNQIVDSDNILSYIRENDTFILTPINK